MTYRFENQFYAIDDFLAHQRVTGLLLIKDGEILIERYQYDRIAEHRFLSHSMAKSITALAVGYALAEGRIKSLDDTVEAFTKICNGEYDNVAEQAFFMCGGLDDVDRKWAEIQKDL